MRNPPPLACLFAGMILASVASAQDVQRDLETIYSTKQVTLALEHHGEVTQRLEAMIQKQALHQVALLHPWEKDQTALLLTTGASSEHGIRPNAHAAFGLAVIHRTMPQLEMDAGAKAIALLRFVLATHGAGGKTCADGKPWRDQWQSAHWATSAGQAAWLLWDDLDPQMKWLAARMICDEADRFIAALPPMQIERDTKAEENAWNSQVMALAYNMFPKHPRGERYREAAIRWQISALATARDLAREDAIDGRAIRAWLKGLSGANLHDDYTLENHDRVHPDYMSTPRMLLYQRLMYEWGGNKPPAAIEFNVKQVYANLKKLSFADGGFVYPNGQDWHLHRNADWIDMHAAMAVMFDDAQAARLMRICLDTAERMIGRSEAGGVYAEGETIFPSSQGMLLEGWCEAYLTMRAHGEGAAPVSAEELWRGFAGVHVFEAGKFALVRTEHSVATMSWGRRPMGMVLPLRRDLLLTPSERSLIGVVEMAGLKREAPVVQRATVKRSADALTVTGVLARGGGAVEQRFAFVALTDGRTIWCDLLRGTSEKRPAEMRLGMLRVLNDMDWVHHDGRRSLYFGENERRIFKASDAASDEPLETSSNWCNLDMLGIVRLRANGPISYEPRATVARGRLEQSLCLNAIDAAAMKNDTDTLAQTALVFYPQQSRRQTQDAAKKCRIDGDAGRYIVELEDGKRVEVDLGGLEVTFR